MRKGGWGGGGGVGWVGVVPAAPHYPVNLETNRQFRLYLFSDFRENIKGVFNGWFGAA